MIRHLIYFPLVLWFFFQAVVTVLAQEQDVTNEWPREIETSKGVVVIYQPQPESLEGNVLKGRAAVALEVKGQAEPIFGAFWFEARLDTDREERVATITDLTVKEVRFPYRDEEKAKQFRILLQTEIPKWQLPISMDRLLTSLELAENQIKAAEKIETGPPTIIFSPEPAVLVTVDGEPRLQQEEGSKLMRVINTAFTILFSLEEKTYYLNADEKTWYKSSEIKGEWSIAETVPAEVAARAPKPEEEEVEPDLAEEFKPGPAPKIIVATEPTELISSNGKPEYTPISGTELLYMRNSDSDVLLHISNQHHYILLAGRWYSSKSLDGPWQYVPGDKLPQDFAAIPEESEMSTVLYAVPGTAMAREAVLDAQMPQTATVDRNKADMSVEFDGEAKFEPISGTNMTYAVNTATPVIHLNNKYYACDQAIWFVADSATGKWIVATSVPSEIYTIPPESSLYNVTFVYVYSATPEVVYVGYTPGYTHTYVYHTTVVYGTGYYYPYWYHRYYYPRTSTWGFHVRYSRWGGWRVGFSYSNGPYRFTFGRGWYRGGWWGPGRHRVYRRGYRHGYRRGRHAGARAGYRAGRKSASRNNMYRNQRNKGRTIAPSSAPSRKTQAKASNKRANNVYADKKGNIHRKSGGNWEQRTQNGWQSDRAAAGQKASRPQQRKNLPNTGLSSKPTQKPSARPSSRPSNLDRSHQARQRGSQQSRSFQQTRSRSGSRGGGRGSGGRGRR